MQLKYDPASCSKCNSTLIIDDIDIAGSRVMINRIFKTTLFHKLQFSKHDKPFLYHPTHRQILFYHAESEWHVTSPNQGLSSTREEEPGNEVGPYAFLIEVGHLVLFICDVCELDLTVAGCIIIVQVTWIIPRFGDRPLIGQCCGTFQARSWIIFHFQGKDHKHAPGLRS